MLIVFQLYKTYSTDKAPKQCKIEFLKRSLNYYDFFCIK